MPDKDDALKAIIDLAIKLLLGLIPAVASFLSIPVIGWIAGLAISWMTRLLYDLVERAARFKKIEEQVRIDVEAAKKAFSDLKDVVQNPSTKDVYDGARARFDDAVSRLGRIRMQ